MRCSNCRNEIPDGSRFCPKCGTRMETVPSEAPVRAATAAEPVKEESVAEPVKEEPEMEPVKEAPSAEPVKEEPVMEPAKETAASVQPAEEFIFCPNCGSRMESGAAFCDNCGCRLDEEEAGASAFSAQEQAAASRVQEETNFCPQCGAKMEPGDVFCQTCGYNLAAPGETTPVSAKPVSEKKGGMAVKLAAAAAVVAVVAVGALVIPKMTSGGKSDGTVMYIKDENIYAASLRKLGKEPVEYAEEIFDDPSESVMTGFIYAYPTASPDGTYKFYVEDVKQNGNGYWNTCTLYYKKKEKDEGTKVDSQITSYDVTASNQVLYLKNDNLYLSDLKEKEKLASDVAFFVTDSTKKRVLWSVNNNDGTSDLYTCDLTAKKPEKQKLSSGIYDWRCSEDYTNIYIFKNEALYQIQNFQKEEKLLNDVYDIMAIDWNKNSFYYTQSVKTTVNALDIVEDDMASADAMLQEPNIRDYQHKEPAGSGWYSYERTVTDTDRYNADRAKYREKQERDQMRQSLAQRDLDVYTDELYYYADGEKKKVCENVSNILYELDSAKGDTNTAAVWYEKYAEGEMKTLKLSELTSVNEVESQYYMSKSESAQSCISARGGETAISLDEELEVSGSFIMDKGKGILYFLAKEEEADWDENFLMAVDLNEKNFGSVQKRDEDVYSLEEVSDGFVYYMKDVNDRSIGDLYCNGEMVLTDASPYRTQLLDGSSAVVSLIDVNDKGQGTLIRIENGKQTELADDVSEWYGINKDSILLLTEYNSNRKRGDLKYFNGKETETVDVDVRAVFCPSKAGQ